MQHVFHINVQMFTRGQAAPGFFLHFVHGILDTLHDRLYVPVARRMRITVSDPGRETY